MDVPTCPGSTQEGPCLPVPASPSPLWTARPQAGIPQGSGSLGVRQAMHRLRNSSKAQSLPSSASQRSLMESEGHPVSRINFALWCQSRVVQFIMGFNPCYSRCSYSNLTFYPPVITEIVFPPSVSFYSLLWLLLSLSSFAFTYTC